MYKWTPFEKIYRQRQLLYLFLSEEMSDDCAVRLYLVICQQLIMQTCMETLNEFWMQSCWKNTQKKSILLREWKTCDLEASGKSSVLHNRILC